MKPKFFKQRGWWVVRAVLNEPKLKGVVIVGRARSVRAAWNDYSRKYNWYRRGCPGMPRDLSPVAGEGKWRNRVKDREGV